MDEMTGWHLDFQLITGSGPVPIGDVDNVSIRPKPRNSTRLRLKGGPKTTAQGHSPWELAFGRGVYNGAIDDLLDTTMDPLRRSKLQAVGTKTDPNTMTVSQYLFTGLFVSDAAFESKPDSTDETMSLTADNRVKIA